MGPDAAVGEEEERGEEKEGEGKGEEEESCVDSACMQAAGTHVRFKRD